MTNKSMDGQKNNFNTVPKERAKKVRSVLQVAILIALVYWAVSLILNKDLFPEPDKEDWNQSNGFIALSYGGITRNPSPGNTSLETFEEHMQALSELGFVSIGIDDVIDFYQNKKQLPQKAVFIMFEGGRKDSAIFTHKTLAKYGFKATMYVISDNVLDNNRFFIGVQELKILSENPFWEIGSFGYKLRYINHMPDESYSFYLAEYLRDLDKNKIETDDQFFARLSEDYELATAPIAKIIGYVPKSYIFMPANTLWESRGKEIRWANEILMKHYFSAVFAREGSCYNDSRNSLLNLTRMQIKPNWTATKLIEEINYWLPNRFGYDLESSKAYSTNDWIAHTGVVSLRDNKLVLTSAKGEDPFTTLRGSDNWDDVSVSVTFERNNIDTQALYLRYASQEQFLRIQLYENVLTVQERSPDGMLRNLTTQYIRDPDPWNINATIRGNRLAISVNGNQLMPPLPVYKQLDYGSVGFGLFSEDKVAEMPFANLVITLPGKSWLAVDKSIVERQQTLRTPIEDFSAVLLPVSEEVNSIDSLQWQRNILPFVMDSLQKGKTLFALLPEGSTDVKTIDTNWSIMPTNILSESWSGVIFRPRIGEDSVSFVSSLNRAIAECESRGLQTAIMAPKDFFEDLKILGDPPGVRWVIVQNYTPTKDDNPLENTSSKAENNENYQLFRYLMHHYGDSNVLVIDTAVNMGVLYSTF